MEYILPLIWGVLGTIVGVFIPSASDKIIKIKKKKKVLTERGEFIKRLHSRIILMIISGTLFGIEMFFEKSLLGALTGSFIIMISILIACIDFRVRIIPNELVVMLAVLGFIFQYSKQTKEGLVLSIITMLSMIIIFSIVGIFIGLDKVGAGDIKLAGAMGAVLGYPLVFHGIIIMSVFLVVFTFIGMGLKKLTMQSMLPFAPFLMIGNIGAIIYAATML